MRALVGRVILGRYRVLTLLARGGMGEVYLARSEGAAGFARPVVVKRVLAQHAHDDGILSMFQREARIMSTLRHPNIVSVLDFGREGDDHLMVIEYVHGFHLGRWIRWLAERGTPFPVERAIQVVLEILAALHHAHSAKGPDGAPLGIVHRDVSPGNVLVDVEGTIKLADFGVARMQGEHTVLEDTGEPSVKGKFPYLPRELFDGIVASGATDVYAAGVVLDELLRGRNAFRGEQMMDTVMRVFEHVPERLSAVRPDVSDALAKVIARAISKAPEQRYQSAAELAAALRAVRASSDQEARQELAAAAARDFLDPEMSRLLGTPSLPELEACWRSPAPPSAELEVTAPEVPAPADPTSPATQLAPPPSRRRSGLVGGIVAALVLATLAGVAVYWLRRPAPLASEGAPLFVVVDRTRAPDAGTVTAATPPPSADAGTARASTQVSTDGAGAAAAGTDGAATDTTPRRRPTKRPVESPFRARSSEIGRCYASHVRALEGTPEITVHFSVAADGSVERASLTPAELAGSALGRCILDVARSTRFDPQPSSVSFRVPLGARRVGG